MPSIECDPLSVLFALGVFLWELLSKDTDSAGGTVFVGR